MSTTSTGSPIHRTAPRARFAALAMITLAASLVVSLTGCGYRAGLAPALGEDRPTSTIGIEIFGNESMVPNLERRLHAELSGSARRHTSLELIAPGSADLVIRGEILGFRRQAGARTGNNRAVETRDIVTVEATLMDRARGVAVGRTRTDIGFGTAIDIPGREPEALDNALRNSADRLLLTLLAGLQYGVVQPGDDDADQRSQARPAPGQGKAPEADVQTPGIR